MNGENGTGNDSKGSIKGLLENGLLDSLIQEGIEFLGSLSSSDVLLAWDVENIERDSWDLKSSITWVKPKVNKSIHGSVAIIRKPAEDGSSVSIYHMFLNKNNELLSEHGSHLLIVTTKEIDDELRNSFGNKDMILLR